MSRLQWGLGLVAIAAAACGGLPPPRPTSSAGTGSGSAIALDSVTSLTEVTSDGEQRPVTRDGVIEVDINSKIRVDVDRDRVAQLFYERAGIDRAQVAALDQRLRELDALTLQQKQNLLQLQALERQLDTVGAAQLAAAPETEGLLNALGRSEGELARNVGDYAKRYRLDAGAFFAGDTSALLDAERQSTLEQAKVLQQRAAELRWRMQAVIASGDKTSPVHLDNYDSYPESVFSMVEKLVPQTTPAELASQLETAKQLAKDTKDLAGLRDAIVKAISTKLSEFVESLRRAVLDDIDAFDKLATAIANDARAIAEVKKLRDDVVALGGPLRTIRTGCSAVVEIVRQGALGHGAVAAAQVCFNELKSQLPVVRPRVEELLRDVGAVEQWAAKNRATLRAAVTRVEDALRQAKAAELLRTFIADGEAKWNALATFLGLAAAQTKAPVWSEDQQTDHPLRVMRAIELWSNRQSTNTARPPAGGQNPQ